MTARATPLVLYRPIRHWATLLLFALSCTRSSKKQSVTEFNQLPEPKNLTQSLAATNRSLVIKREAGAAIVDHSHIQNCLDTVDEKLDPNTWYDAAAQACHPGSKRHSATVSRATVRDGQVTFDIPPNLKASCWTAFAIADHTLLPILVDIIDRDGIIQPLGVLSSNRSTIPSFGPFCALRAHFNTLRLRPATSAIGKVSLAFYAFD